MNTPNSEKLNFKEASEKLQISQATLKNWIKSGLITPEQDGSQYFLAKNIQNLQTKIKKGLVKKLDRRANKNESTKKHAHPELIHSKEEESLLIEYLQKYQTTPKLFLFSLYLTQLKKLKLIEWKNERIQTKYPHILEELKLWNVLDKNISSIKVIITELEKSKLNLEHNLLGYSYQFLTNVGDKNKSGSYYTPKNVITKILNDIVTQKGLVYDPCCGSGNFLIETYLHFLKLKVKNPECLIWGSDIDPEAILNARANLTLISNGLINTIKQILNEDSLIQCNTKNTYDYILTNPPWGASFTDEQIKFLKKKFPFIKTSESFSFFIANAITHLKKDGCLGFVLPVSFLNIKSHEDIRKHILKNTSDISINAFSNKFSGVFTSFIALYLKNKKPNSKSKVIINSTKSYSTTHAQILKSPDSIISLSTDNSSLKIMNHMDKTGKLYLKDNADWALGIVTGDNKRFLFNTKSSHTEPILKGSDILRYRIQKPSNHIIFEKDKLQQVAPEEKYRVKEKLVYRFICKELVFAIDRNKTLTLNSANILIPKINDLSIEVICALLNSKVAQFYYQKKFNTVKTLRGNLEAFPFPEIPHKEQKEIESLVKKLEMSFDKDICSKLDEKIMDIYNIPQKWREEIKAIALSESFDVWKN